ncbi:sugar nucleotidyltransferase [bacterium]|nr:MAG: sugar nucleotidyltransferase [bacterium]
MLAIIPAAGKGERLKPLTNIAPKPLLPVYNKPMIFYPLLSLKEAGIKEIIIVVDKNNKSYFKDFFKDGKKFGFKIRYAIQKEQKGIAHAIGSAEKLAKNKKIIVIHADNIFSDNLKKAVSNFKKQSFNINKHKVGGAKIILKQVSDPKRFGVVEFDNDKIIGVEEKPAKPKSNWITAGFYMFDERVFDIIRKLKPSARGEYEISDLVDFYVKEGTITYEKIKGAWFDVGTIRSLHEASDFIAHNQRLREWNF